MTGQPTANATIHYSVAVANLHAHLFQVTLTIARPIAGQHVSLPVWIPGSYLVREFSKNLLGLQARQPFIDLPLEHSQGGIVENVGHPQATSSRTVRSAYTRRSRAAARLQV